jgi:hypothetical protein
MSQILLQMIPGLVDLLVGREMDEKDKLGTSSLEAEDISCRICLRGMNLQHSIWSSLNEDSPGETCCYEKQKKEEIIVFNLSKGIFLMFQISLNIAQERCNRVKQ